MTLLKCSQKSRNFENEEILNRFLLELANFSCSRRADVSICSRGGFIADNGSTEACFGDREGREAALGALRVRVGSVVMVVVVLCMIAICI